MVWGSIEYDITDSSDFAAIKVGVDDKEWGWDGPFVEVETLADEEECF